MTVTAQRSEWRFGQAASGGNGGSTGGKQRRVRRQHGASSSNDTSHVTPLLPPPATQNNTSITFQNTPTGPVTFALNTPRRASRPAPRLGPANYQRQHVDRRRHLFQELRHQQRLRVQADQPVRSGPVFAERAARLRGSGRALDAVHDPGARRRAGSGPELPDRHVLERERQGARLDQRQQESAQPPHHLLGRCRP